MKSFIEKTFKRLLHIDVKVFLGQDDSYIDDVSKSYRIYRISSQNKGYSEGEFCETYPEFSIFQLPKSKKWGYDILKQTFIGDFETPPDWDYVESNRVYGNVDESLLGLIEEILKIDWNNLLMSREDINDYN